MDVVLTYKLAMALALGALIGLERQFQGAAQEQSTYFGGIRTFPFIAVVGALCSYLGNMVWAPFLGLGLLAVAAMLTISHFVTSRVHGGTGLTTEFAGLLTYLLGVLAEMNHTLEAFALATVVMGLLRMKDVLHDFSSRLEVHDLEAILKFAVVTAIVLPLLPNDSFGPYGVVNPREAWFMVVLISAIGFAGYVSIRLWGANRGIRLTGFLGGLVSSTAVTLTFSRRAKTGLSLGAMFGSAVIIANLTMIPRIAVEVAVAGPSLLPVLLPVLSVMLVVGLLVWGLQWMKDRKFAPVDVTDFAVEFQNPLRLRSAIAFGLMYAAVIVLVRVAQHEMPEGGTYLVAVLSGAPDVNAITLSLARLHEEGALSTEVASRAVILAALSNGLLKLGIASFLGTGVFRRNVLTALGAMLLAGVGCLFVL